MLKIVKNNTDIAELKDQNYVFYTRDFGGTKPYYGKISFATIIEYLQDRWKYMCWRIKNGAS